VNKDDELVGIVTQSDLFRAFVTFMGLKTKGTRITIDVADRPGVLADITRIVKEVGMSIASLSTFVPPDKRRGNVIVRVKSCHAKPLVDRLVEKGYWVGTCFSDLGVGVQTNRFCYHNGNAPERFSTLM